MSQVSTVQVEETIEKPGETNGKKWVRYGLKDGNGEWYSTFEAGVIRPDLKGRKVELEWEQNGQFKNLLRASPVEEPPTPGTGDYIKGKEAPETQRSIHASVALQEAVNALQFIESPRTPENCLYWANQFYRWLRDRAEGKGVDGTGMSPSGDVPL